MSIVIVRNADGVSAPATPPRDLPLVAVLARIALAVAAREVAYEQADHLRNVDSEVGPEAIPTAPSGIPPGLAALPRRAA